MHIVDLPTHLPPFSAHSSMRLKHRTHTLSAVMLVRVPGRTRAESVVNVVTVWRLKGCHRKRCHGARGREANVPWGQKGREGGGVSN